MMHLDTTILVDLVREKARGTSGPASRFIVDHQDEEFWMSVHALCELRTGVELARDPPRERDLVERLRRGIPVAYPDEEFPIVYATLFAGLSRRGERMGTMDLLIATAAVKAGAGLVTRNVKDFSRVPGLRVIGY